MSTWFVVLLLALPIFWLGRCLLVFVAGDRIGGTCKLCVAATFLVVVLWPSLSHFAETSGVPFLTRFPEVGVTDDIGVRFLVAGAVLLVIGALLHVVPWLVRRWDRQRFSRRPQYLHGNRLLPLFFPRGSSDDHTLHDVESGVFEAADDGGGFDAGDVGGVD